MREGHSIHLVYEACGFGFGLCRELRNRGVDCQVIAPQRLDEKNTGVKTDSRAERDSLPQAARREGTEVHCKRDAKTLCLRLDRWLQGNRDALATIRIPTPEEEQKRQIHRQREQFVRQKTKLQAQGRCLLVNQGLVCPTLWWRKLQWEPLKKQLPDWILFHLETTRPLLELLEKQIKLLTEAIVAEVQATQTSLPKGLGELTAGVVGGEVMDWTRFNNRAQVSSYTGLCPGEPSGAR